MFKKPIVTRIIVYPLLLIAGVFIAVSLQDRFGSELLCLAISVVPSLVVAPIMELLLHRYRKSERQEQIRRENRYRREDEERREQEALERYEARCAKLLLDPFKPISKMARQSLSQEALSTLLTARHAVVDLFGRDALMNDLKKWANNKKLDPVSTRLYYAEGGNGKTRLLMDLVRHCKGEPDWRAGFLPEKFRKEEPDANDILKEVLAREKQVLFVLDYAESRGEDIKWLLLNMEQIQETRSFRIVLLTRRVDDWWEHFVTTVDGTSKNWLTKCDPKLLPAPSENEADITKLTQAMPEKQRIAAFEQAIQHFSSKFPDLFPEIEKPRRPSLADEVIDGKNKKKHFNRILFIHIAALTWLKGDTIEGEDELLDFVVERDAAIMQREIEERKLAVGLDVLKRAMALVTLLGGMEKQEEIGRAITVFGTFDENTTRNAVDLLVDLYGERGGERNLFQHLHPIEPDVIGEHWVEGLLMGEDGQLLLEEALDERRSDSQTRQALTVLGRICKRNGDKQVCLKYAFGLDLPRLSDLGWEVALEVGDPMGKVLAEVLRNADDLDTAANLAERIPKQTVCLRELAAVATELAYRKVEDGDNRTEKARLLNNQSVRLSALGRHEEALAAIEEAVKIRRELADKRPDAFRPDLASSLNNMSAFLSALGRHEEALAASEETVSLLKPYFLRLPLAFAQNMQIVLRVYIEACQKLSREPDTKLLEPIAAVFEKLNGQPSGPEETQA